MSITRRSMLALPALLLVAPAVSASPEPCCERDHDDEDGNCDRHLNEPVAPKRIISIIELEPEEDWKHDFVAIREHDLVSAGPLAIRCRRCGMVRNVRYGWNFSCKAPNVVTVMPSGVGRKWQEAIQAIKDQAVLQGLQIDYTKGIDIELFRMDGQPWLTGEILTLHPEAHAQVPHRSILEVAVIQHLLEHKRLEVPLSIFEKAETLTDLCRVRITVHCADTFAKKTAENASPTITSGVDVGLRLWDDSSTEDRH